MAIYVFNLLVGYLPNGVDYAQGYRNQMIRDISPSMKYVFTELPSRKYVNRYRDAGIGINQMLSMHQYFSDNRTMELFESVADKLEELKNSLYYTDIIYRDTEIQLLKNDALIAVILLEQKNRDSFYGIHYFNEGKLIRTEFCTIGISYVNYYVTAKSEKGLYARLVRRTFYNKDGSVAYDQLFEEKREWYLFPDGKRLTKSQLTAEFVKKLNLKEQDIVLLDRSAQFDFVQPLFQFGKRARFIAVFHSGHYFEKNEDPNCLYLNYEYYYWFKYSKWIDTMVVSTQEQKKELIDKLQEYKCSVPNVEVIPAGGIEQLRYPETRRKPYSLLSVSRLDPRKKIDWMIKGVIQAYQNNAAITLDIYGNGDDSYVRYLREIVEENHAQSYIRFMGWTDVTELYKNYEVYITTSLWETLGLSVMEAAGSGMAIIGLDVRYGNRLFIHPEENGYLIDFDISYVNGDDSQLIDDMADKIIEIFADEERLKEFHRNSYEISKNFSAERMEEKWRNLLFKKLTEKENTT